MNWRKSKDDDDQDQLINLEEITHIFIGRFTGEDDEISRVLVRYSTGNKCLSLYNGTYVECIKVMENLSEQLNSQEFDIWGEQGVKE